MAILKAIYVVIGKISGLMNKTQESVSKANSFTSAEGCATYKIHSSFYP
jgi:hypothetical protein